MGPGDMVTIADGRKIRVELIPSTCTLGRRLVDRLAYHWDVPKHWFYNPLMIPGEEDKRKPC